MRKPTICIGENKGADQLRSNCEADQRLCFRYSDSTILLLSESKFSNLYQSSVIVHVQAGLWRICSETTLLVFSCGGSVIDDNVSCHRFIKTFPHFMLGNFTYTDSYTIGSSIKNFQVNSFEGMFGTIRVAMLLTAHDCYPVADKIYQTQGPSKFPFNSLFRRTRFTEIKVASKFQRTNSTKGKT